MTPEEIADWLSEMWINSPDQKSGEEAYRWLHSRVERVVKDGREQLIGGLRIWLSLESEPETTVAAKLAADFHLIELRQDLILLLENIEAGRTKFPPGLKSVYANLIAGYLSRI